MALSKDEELELLLLEKEKRQRQKGQSQKISEEPGTIKTSALQGLKAGLTGPAQLTRMLAQNIQKDPEKAFQKYGSAMPILGGTMGGPIGAAGGELLRQTVGTALGSVDVPKTALGRFGSVMGQGIAMEPKMLTAIPGVGQAGEYLGGLAKQGAGALGKTAAKVASAITGLPEESVKYGYKKGIETYLAPRLSKAQKIFAKAVGVEGGELEPTTEEIYDTGKEKAKEFAKTVSDKIRLAQQGQLDPNELHPLEVLKARQNVDRIIKGTSVWDTGQRNLLYKERAMIDDYLSQMSEGLSKASKTYRGAVVKSQFLSPFRLTKQGKFSAVVPLLTALKGGGGVPAATSPLLYGLGITGAGSAEKLLTSLMQIPAFRQFILSQSQNKMSQRTNNQSEEAP